MAASYIPPKDSNLATWAANFAALTTANPALYGLDATSAAAIATANAAWQAAYTVITTPATKSVTTVAAKNTAKLSFISIARLYGRQISINPGVTNGDKLALGLNLPNNTPTPVPAPTSYPILTVLGATPLQHTLSVSDQNTPNKRSKPQGAIQLQLFLGVSSVPLTDPTLCNLYSTPTKMIPIPVNFDSGQVGKVATYFGRWATRAGLVGAFSAATSNVIA